MSNNNTLTSYLAPKILKITLPGDLGELDLRPTSSASVILGARTLLIGTYLYSFQAVMTRVKDRWYFVNKADLGQPGARPSPKKQQETLDIISVSVNEYMEKDSEFQLQVNELRQREEIEARKYARRQLFAEYRTLRAYANEAVLELGRSRARIEWAQGEVAAKQQNLEEFERAHPEILDTSDFEGS